MMAPTDPAPTDPTPTDPTPSDPAPSDPADRLHATEYGTAEVGSSGSRVAFLHGFLGQGKNWTTVARALSEQHQVLLLDLPNHGHSPWTDHVSYPNMAAAVAAELSARSAAPWAVVGHSMGGKVAMALALTRPELVDRLCVVDIAPVRYPIGHEPYVAAMRALDLTDLPDRKTAEARMAAAEPDRRIRSFLLQNLHRCHDSARGLGRWSWQPNLRLLGDELGAVSDWPDLQQPPYEGPVLWIAGAESDYVLPAYAPVMRALFPHVRLVTVKQAGHWVHAEQPAVFTATVRAFLAESGRQG